MIIAVLSRTAQLALNRFGTLFAAGWGYMLLLVAVNLAISMALAPDGGFTTGSYMTEPFEGADDIEKARALRLLAVVATPFLALMMVLKLSLILPAAAVDDDLSLGESWRATRGLGLALVLAGTVAILACGLATGAWALLLFIADAFIPQGGMAAQLRSALFPMGTMAIVTWIFASLHATIYALVRERFAEEVGFSADDVKRSQALRTIATAHHMSRDRG
ncbi:hypothetical protein HPQ64_04945 [Rhizobiales bacterium]|uniref:hypothetical protein n=1 Tax=Hongsoonwoonella zoysiae TaxID=2821844 RepID=UPI001560FF87|nr:hypothetical protein [Hongsoonwoonella zoysiae]NRG17027.1 hypothetical protein [Hongsoonwoonella zoysiae]